MNRVKTIVVGCGYIAQAEHIPALLGSRAAELVAIVEPREELRRRLAERLGIPAFEDLEGAIDTVASDAVDICTGPMMHAKLIRQATAAGKHVLCEKPLSHSATEAQAAVQSALDSGVLLEVGYMRHFDADVLKAKELIDHGVIGSVRAVQTVFKLAYPPSFPSMIDRPDEVLREPSRENTEPADAVPSDQIINQSLHHLNLIRYLSGDITEILGAEKNDAAVSVQLRLKNGALAHHLHATGMGNGEEFTVYGENGMIQCKLWSPHLPYQFPQLTVEVVNQRQSTVHHIARVNPYQQEIETFAEQVLAGRRESSTGNDAIRDLRVIEAIHRSLSNGTRSEVRA